ncbi:response regulator [Flavobacterium sp. GT3R68]|uniref:response regulator n=1 Tax=Flavobacterium sp. GT3R68 TaxID=2594437 RepID=UPI000F861768|nr:response regulator [Flavobacterium sp. GT3R68]RTY89666.1 response regulator [Flavobacterium sp. GSN2]TRW89448.1 response regulator [Flavobacterium sp. GT3R68]
MKFKKVFIVDDDKVFHFIIKKLLLKNNIETVPVFFENGLDAIIELKDKIDFENDLPDLILVDINMPIMDGWQFLEEFRTIKNQLKKQPLIYLISSSNDSVDLNKSADFKKEITSYLLKPMDGEQINKIF